MGISESASSLITTTVVEQVSSSTAYATLFGQTVENSWHVNIENGEIKKSQNDSSKKCYGLATFGFESLYSDKEYYNGKDDPATKLRYYAMNYNYPASGSKVTIDYIINNSALKDIGELYAARTGHDEYGKEFVNKNMTWPLYGVMAYMNAIGANPAIITAKYDKYSKLYDMAYNTDYARAGDHSKDVEQITVSKGRLVFSVSNKYAKPMVFSVINKDSAFADGDNAPIKDGDFKIRIRNIEMPMRAFRMSDHRYVVIAPEYLFANKDQYDAITCVEYKSESLDNPNWIISYSYATSPNSDETAANRKMYPAIEYSTSNAFNLSVMTSSL